MNHKTLSIAALVGSAILALTPAFPAQAAGRRPSDILAYTPEAGQVTNVIDGQTIQVALSGGSTVTVRYIGITAPTGSECMAWQATNDNAALMLGKTVRMEKDALEASPDGSVLYRYVYLLNATMANEEMIKNGDAKATIVAPNLKHQARSTIWRRRLAPAASACGAHAAQPLRSPRRLGRVSRLLLRRYTPAWTKCPK